MMAIQPKFKHWSLIRMNGNQSSMKVAVAQTEALLAELWQRNRHIFKRRLESLEQAAAAASKGSITREEREEAASTSHKLAGSLGMFGYHRGTEIARELEVLFRDFRLSYPDRITPLTIELRETTFPRAS